MPALIVALQPVLTVQSTGRPLLAPVLLLACWRTCRIGPTFLLQFSFAAHIGRSLLTPFRVVLFRWIRFRRNAFATYLALLVF